MKITKENNILGVRKKRGSMDRTMFILCCTVLPVVQWLIFYVYTNFSSIALAFTGADGQFTLYNFKRILDELSMETSNLSIAFRNTMLTFGILMITFPLKVLVSYFIYKKIPGHKIYRIVFFLPSVLFSVCTAMVFTRLVGVNGFIAETVGELFHLGAAPELLGDSRFANATVLLNMLWLQFPGDLIIWGGTFARIPVDVLEAGRIDGTTWWTEFTKITVPMVWPTVALKMVLLFCGIFSASGNVWLLTSGNYGTETIASWQYKRLMEYTGSFYIPYGYNYLSAVGLVLTVIAIIIALTVRKITDKFFADVEY